jgi:hypothetical protein
VRPFLPQAAFADKVNTICKAKQIDADVSSICFSGIGQWYMNAVKRTEGSVDWHTRQAKDCALPHVPKEAVVVVDISMASRFPVRDEFERYGAAAFFNEKKEAIAVWIDHEETMVFPPPDGAGRLTKEARDWEFALWRFRVSVFFQGFAVGHLVTVHWGMSNSLVVGTRESLDPHHPLRELITPYLHGAITINKSAIVNLGSARGAIVRIGALQMGEPPEQLIASLAKVFEYETFPQFLENKGMEPEMLKSLPMVEDGLKLWNVIEAFVRSYLSLYYDNEKDCADNNNAKLVTGDADVVAFWAKCKGTSDGFCNLPDLTFDSLVGYLSTCFFYCTAVHEILGNVNFMTMMPRCLSGRIHKRDRFGDNPYQASIQDWYRIICVVASTTLQSVPMFISEQYRSAKYFYNLAVEEVQGDLDAIGKMEHIPDYEAGKITAHKIPRPHLLARCFHEFGESLVAISDEIEAANSGRDQPFGSFNPKRMEISVSL